jgi:hypothetical protein
MSRAASRSPSVASPSWLFAAPATARQRSRGIVVASSTPPRAHGERTSHGSSSTPAAGSASTPCAATTAATRSSSTSATPDLGARGHEQSHELAPTWPTPCTTTRRPAGSGVPNASQARRADAVQHAEGGHRRGVPRAAEALVEAGHPRRLPAHPLHVLRRRPDVLRRRCSGPPSSSMAARAPAASPRRAAAPARAARRPSAALVEPRGGGLQRHRLRQAEDVDERALLVGIGSRTARRRAPARAPSSGPR